MRLILLVTLLLLLGCSDDRKSDLADSISGPGVDIHCFNASTANRPAVGDTNVRVTCPPAGSTP